MPFTGSFNDTYTHFFYRQFLLRLPTVPNGSINLHNKTGIVTGANSGLGFESCRQLLSLGLSTLILAVRDEAKGTAARDKLVLEHPSADIQVWMLDMAARDSIVAFVERCNTQLSNGINFVVLNAGVFRAKFKKNETTGVEETVDINWVATALLTVLLLPVLRKTPDSRITLVGSDTAGWAAFKEQNSPSVIEALNDPKKFRLDDRYYTSKLLQLLFFRELTSRVDSSVVVINSTNPGFCYGSGLLGDTSGIINLIAHGMRRVIGRSAKVGARTYIDAAVVKSSDSHGKYLSDCRISPFPGFCSSSKGPEIQAKVWKELMQELKKSAPVEEIISQCSKT